MSINATTSSAAASSASSTAQVSSAANSENAKKASSDSSFKEEMDKVSSSESETKTEKKDSVKSDNKVESVEGKTDKDNSKDTQLDDNKSAQKNDLDQQNMTLEGNIDYSNFASISMNDVNSMLSNDIRQMMNTNNSAINPLSDISGVSKVSSAFRSFDSANSLSMTQSDADFFINLTQKNDVSMQNVVAQAQTMVDNGAEAKEVKQNMQVSQTLLNALSNSRETNQPVRIDFDQNVSVILRVNKDGVISANFIPGDKAVEQYLRTNINSLKATFAENDLPYTDLSYSNRGSRQQKENRRNNR